MKHSTEVDASSAKEAAAMGIGEILGGALEVVPAMGEAVIVRVPRPDIVRQLELHKIADWVRAPGNSPRENSLKLKVRGSWKV